MSEAVNKIKKLLRLGQSNNPNEAGLALERAFELAARHNIDVSTLDLDDEIERLINEKFCVGSRLKFLQARAGSLLVAFFNVEVVYSRSEIELIGRESDVAIARHVYDVVVREAKRWLGIYEQAQNEMRLGVTTNKRRSFIQGFIYGIAEQLNQKKHAIELEDARFAIVLADQKKQRDQYVDELYPGIQPKRNITVAKPQKTALVSGFLRGRQTRIASPLTSSKAQPSLSFAA